MVNAPTTDPPPLKVRARSALNAALPLMERIATARGAAAISPGINELISGDTMQGLCEGSARVAEAISAGQRIAIVGDYDADGATATSVLLRAFKAWRADVFYVVPSRFTQGYGLSAEIVRHCRDRGARLIVTVDNGIAAWAGAEAARAENIDLVVTDHHLPGNRPVDAYAVVNPNQHGCVFPSKSIAGCGVALYLVLKIRRLLGAAYDFNPSELLDLVALGTIADVVRLDDNNRALVAAGLRRIRSEKCSEGILMLCRAAGVLPSQVTCTDVAFKIAPRINAAGRMAGMGLGIDCLTSDDRAAASDAAVALNNVNAERRERQADMLAVAEKLLPAVSDDKRSVCVQDESFHEGIVGIIAGKLREKHDRPTVVFSSATDGHIKGSGRSLPGLHLRDILDWVDRQAPGLIEKFGGHAMAAGLTLKAVYFARFAELFEAAVVHMELMNGSPLERDVHWHDGSLAGNELGLGTANILADGVWGNGFELPSFVDRFEVIESRTLKEAHTALKLGRDGQAVRAIWFNCVLSQAQSSIDLLYRPAINRWNGENLQLEVIGRV